MWEQDVQQYFILIISSWRSTFYVKKKTFLCPLRIVYSKVNLFLRLLKVAFFARQKSQTVFISPFLSPSDGRFRISLNPFSLWLLKVATMEIMPFWLVRVSQKLLSHQKAELTGKLWVTTANQFQLLDAPTIEREREWSFGRSTVCDWSRQIQFKPPAFGRNWTMWTILRLQEGTYASW